ncbi:MAG: protease, partial [Pseudomonadota bacterium]
TGNTNIDGTGNGLANTITGNNGNNILNGAWGDDILIGGAGDDVFLDDNGNDIFTGGSGSDTFVFLDDFGVDKITDLEDGIDLISMENVSSVTGFADLQISQDGVDTIIFVGSDSIRLQGIQATDVDQNDFLF